MSSTSGGTGKKDDSANASKNRAGTPYGVSAQWRTQSYNFLIIFNGYRILYEFFRAHFIEVHKKGGVKITASLVKSLPNYLGGGSTAAAANLKAF
jgi:hypothetical protein